MLYPSVAWGQRSAAWFFTARGGVHFRDYSLDTTTPALPERHPQVTVPIASLDAGLVFEREARILDTDVIQTLEPRAFYVYIPFRRQDQTPVFDTAIDDFNFTQLFSENRYLGSDRVGDANQLTLALTSRFLDPGTGAERLRLAVGERFYFADQLRDVSASGFDLGNFLGDMMAGIDPVRELKRRSEVNDAHDRAIAARKAHPRYMLWLIDSSAESREPAESSRATALTSSLREIETLLGILSAC